MTQAAEELNAIVAESVQLAAEASDLDIKKARLDYAMKKLLELIRLANEYSFIDFRKISGIYEQIREVRSGIRDMESASQVGQDQISVVPGIAEDGSGTAGSDEQAVCPYCNFKLPVMPGHKQPCPSCKRMIRVWYSTSQSTRKLITDEEARQMEREITERIETYEWLNKQDTLEQSDAEVMKIQAELKEKDPDTSLEDAYLFLIEKKLSLTRRYQERSGLHYLKALILDASGKEFFADLKESRKWELMHLKANHSVKHVKVITAKGCCHACRTLSDKTYSIDEALRLLPLPHGDCIRPLQGYKGFCRCSYLVVSESATT